MPVHILSEDQSFPFGRAFTDHLADKRPLPRTTHSKLSLMASLKHPALLPFRVQTDSTHAYIIYEAVPRAWNGEMVRADLLDLALYLNGRGLLVPWQSSCMGVGPDSRLQYCLRYAHLLTPAQPSPRPELEVTQEVHEFYASIQKAARLRVKKVVKSLEEEKENYPRGREQAPLPPIHLSS